MCNGSASLTGESRSLQVIYYILKNIAKNLVRLSFASRLDSRGVPTIEYRSRQAILFYSIVVRDDFYPLSAVIGFQFRGGISIEFLYPRMLTERWMLLNGDKRLARITLCFLSSLWIRKRV